jgi:hypothetical protein
MSLIFLDIASGGSKAPAMMTPPQAAPGERLDSKLEWQGAEFLVLANLLIEKIEAYKPYVNQPGYDLVAFDSKTRRLARLSVKSRWATNREGLFPLHSLDCDFVIHVALNRGIRIRKATSSLGLGQPKLYVFPVKACAAVRTASNKINIRNIDNYESYLANWSRIRKFLNRH